MQAEVEKIDPHIFAKTAVLRKRLRLVRRTVQERQERLDEEEWSYLQMVAERSWSPELESLGRNIDIMHMELDIFQQREQEILSCLQGYPEIYRDLWADVLDSTSWTERDC